jgi:HEAT repeat protein
MRSILLLLATVEVVLFAVGIGIMAVRGIVARRREERIATVRAHLVQYAGAPGETALPQALADLRPALAGRLLAQLASQLKGRDRARVVDLARQAGVHAMADKWRRSRRWRRRLRGAQLHTALGHIDKETIHLLGDPKPLVRAEAARAVATSPKPWLCSRLASMLDDESLACRLAAKDALIRSGGHAVEAVAAALLDRTVSQRSVLALLEIAARQGDPRALEAIVTHRDDPDPVVRAATVGALGRFGGQEARRAVLEVRDDADVGVRAAAMEALGRIAVADDASLIVGGLSDRSWAMREASAVALSRLGAVGRMHLRRIARGSDVPAADVATWVLEAGGRRRTRPTPAPEVAV